MMNCKVFSFGSFARRETDGSVLSESDGLLKTTQCSLSIPPRPGRVDELVQRVAVDHRFGLSRLADRRPCQLRGLQAALHCLPDTSFRFTRYLNHCSKRQGSTTIQDDPCQHRQVKCPCVGRKTDSLNHMGLPLLTPVSRTILTSQSLSSPARLEDTQQAPAGPIMHSPPS
jgi:hypothetical protein